MEKQVYSVNEVAKMLGVTSQTVRRELVAGRLESVIVGTRHKIPQAAFDKYIEVTK